MALTTAEWDPENGDQENGNMDLITVEWDQYFTNIIAIAPTTVEWDQENWDQENGNMDRITVEWDQDIG